MRRKMEHIKKNIGDQWLTLKEALIYTTLSESTIRKYINNGCLKVSKATGKLLFKKNDVDDFLQEKTNGKSAD